MAPREAHCNVPVPPAQGCADKLVPRTALRLIRQLPDRVTYELSNDAVSQLCSMGHCPIAVVCVAGVARQGKSYILNRLVEAAGGFAVSPSVQPCTHGIWMWPEAVTVNGKAHKLVLLDTEGVASREQTAQASANMVALSGLVSSLLICNQMGSFNENCIENLGQSAAILKGLFGKQGVAAMDGLATCDPPALLLLLRDFGLEFSEAEELAAQGMTPREHLEDILADIPLAGADLAGLKSKNSLRAVIREVFPNRDCLCLKRPCLRTGDLPQKPDSALEPEFLEGLEALRTRVFGGVQPKTFKGAIMTGPLMVELLTAAIAAVNKPGGVLNIGSMWSALLDAELKAAAAAAQDSYKAVAKELTTCKTPQQAEKVHQEALLSASRAFIEGTKFADDMSRAGGWAAIEKQLTHNFTGFLERIKRQQIECQMLYDKLLFEAKNKAFKVLDWERLMKGLADCADESQAVKQVQVAADQAWAAFSSTIGTWQGDKPTDAEARLTVAEEDLQTAVEAARATAVQGARAAAAANETKMLAADKERMQQEFAVVGKQNAALLAGVQEYKQQLRERVRSSNSVDDLQAASEAVLAKLLSTLPADLPTEKLEELREDLLQQCEDILDRSMCVVEERAASQAHATLIAAAREAMDVFRADVERVKASCKEDQAWEACQEAKMAATQKFHRLAAEQSTYKPTSKEYDTTLQSFLKDIGSWSDKLIEGVRNNAAAAMAAADLQKFKVDTERAMKEQKGKSDADLKALIESNQALVQRQEDRIASINSRIEASRQQDGQMASLMADMMQQMMLLAVGGYGGSYRRGFNSSQRTLEYPQPCTVTEIDDGDSPPSRDRGIGITVKGTKCKVCLRGNCHINHHDYIN